MAVGCALLGAAVYSSAAWLSFFLWLGTVASIGLWIRECVVASRYSLEKLKEFSEKESARQLAREIGTVNEADTVACPYCLEAYPSELSACPFCGH